MSRKKPKTRPRITNIDSKIFADLHKAGRPLPVQRLAKRVDLSWKTTNEHIKKLENLNVLKTQKTVRRTNVFIEPKFATLLKKKKR